MPQVFKPRANSIAKVLVFGGISTVVVFFIGLGVIVWSPWATRENRVRAQPVPFSHAHHVGGLGLDCRYCHTSVETSSYAGMPSTDTCMNCHSYIWHDAKMLEPVRQSWMKRQPLPWTRVNDLPDYVYFNHSIHVAKGVGCETCHGRVDRMPLTWKAHSYYMKWCLDCHRQPEKYLRPREDVFKMGWRPSGNQEELGAALVARYHVKKHTDCYTCHR